jgi:hypothetical protein
MEQWRDAAAENVLNVFKLSSGERGLRKPYLMPTDASVETLHNQPGVAEIDELAEAAGFRPRAVVRQ